MSINTNIVLPFFSFFQPLSSSFISSTNTRRSRISTINCSGRQLLSQPRVPCIAESSPLRQPFLLCITGKILSFLPPIRPSPSIRFLSILLIRPSRFPSALPKIISPRNFCSQPNPPLLQLLRCMHPHTLSHRTPLLSIDYSPTMKTEQR
jgi:hypothetical protein